MIFNANLVDSTIINRHSPACIFIYFNRYNYCLYTANCFIKRELYQIDNYILEKENNKYEGVFGVLVDNLNYTGVAL
jgi:hypothetical protein